MNLIIFTYYFSINLIYYLWKETQLSCILWGGWGDYYIPRSRSPKNNANNCMRLIETVDARIVCYYTLIAECYKQWNSFEPNRNYVFHMRSVLFVLVSYHNKYAIDEKNTYFSSWIFVCSRSKYLVLIVFYDDIFLLYTYIFINRNAYSHWKQ